MGYFDFRSLKKGKSSTPSAFAGDLKKKTAAASPTSSAPQPPSEVSPTPRPKRGRDGSSQASLAESPSKCLIVLVDLDSSSPQPIGKAAKLPPTSTPIKWYNNVTRPGSSAVFGNDFRPYFSLKPDFMKGTNVKLLKKYSLQEEIKGIQVMCLRTIATAQFLMQEFEENKSKMNLMKTEFAHVDNLKGELAKVKAELAEANEAREEVASHIVGLKKRMDDGEEKLKMANSEKEVLEGELASEKAAGLKLKSIMMSSPRLWRRRERRRSSINRSWRPPRRASWRSTSPALRSMLPGWYSCS